MVRKHDLSSTDMHPFIHPFNPAISAPWEAKSDWDIFKALAKAVSNLAEEMDMEPVKEAVATPLLHDTPQEMAQPLGKSKIGAKATALPFPAKQCRKFMLWNGITSRFSIR